MTFEQALEAINIFPFLFVIPGQGVAYQVCIVYGQV